MGFNGLISQYIKKNRAVNKIKQQLMFFQKKDFSMFLNEVFYTHHVFDFIQILDTQKTTAFCLKESQQGRMYTCIKIVLKKNIVFCRYAH